MSVRDVQVDRRVDTDYESQDTVREDAPRSTRIRLALPRHGFWLWGGRRRHLANVRGDLAVALPHLLIMSDMLGMLDYGDGG